MTVDKQYYWEQAEKAMHKANTLNLVSSEEYRNRVTTLVRLAEVNLKMMEVAPDSE